jgi:hypothetical protein
MKSFVAAMLAAFATAVSDVAWDSLGHFKIHNPAYLTMSRFHKSDPFLLTSSFQSVGNGGIYVVPGVKDAIVSG